MKQTPALIIVGTALIISALGIAYGIGAAMKLPIPLVKDGIQNVDYSAQNKLIKEWDNVRIYQMAPAPPTVEQIVQAAPATEDTSDNTFVKKFTEVDENTLQKYVANNAAVAANGYTKLLIDKVDANNTPTGIKTTEGDDILAIDSYDNIIVAGLTVNGQKAKLAIVKDNKKIDLSVVDDLRYWDTIDTHAIREKAILAINASGYTWNNTGNYGTMFGMAIRNGDFLRKANSPDQTVGFTKDGKMEIGGSVADLYNACEYTPILIKDGNAVYSGTDTNKAARTAIGQTANGDILMLVVDGDTNTTGATLGDMLSIMRKYGAVNASNLSEGQCSVMWWNGRIVNTPFGDSSGVKLPTVWAVKPESAQ